jgi:hypothetical protein
VNAPARILSHEEVKAKLDQDLASVIPPLPLSRPWSFLCGDVPVVCSHIRIDKVQLKGMTQVTCLTCEAEWKEVPT